MKRLMDVTVALWMLTMLLPESISAQMSMDEADRAAFAAVTSPLAADAAFMQPTVMPDTTVMPAAKSLSLSGEWSLAPDDGDGHALWDEAVTAHVPGTVHRALFEQGIIPDPMVGRNDSIAEKCSYKCWWYKKTFTYDGSLHDPLLTFEGVANRCKVWLNGKLLGEHEGMFGGPDFDVKRALKKGENILVVRLDSIPQTYLGGWPATANEAWKYSVVINCVYGWHYAKIPSLGIWQPVALRERPAVRIENPFIATRSVDGDMRLVADLKGKASAAELTLIVKPLHFEGKTQVFGHTVKGGAKQLAFDFKIDQPALWWPNGMGGQPLYEAIVILSSQGRKVCATRLTFGVRTIEMRPFPEGAAPDKYNWTFVINGKPLFVKGTGWCTADALLDCSRERYARFLHIAKLQNIQMLRAWGGGMPETDTFYNLCDSLGIMVMQEWPTAWNSHNTQPAAMLRETVTRNTLRLRNHPSLVMWGAGNESDKPFGEAIDMMGRAAIELDGSRPFHRGEAWGGSLHNYNCWWDNYHLNHNLNMTAPFWGEFGIPSLPVCESVLRYLDGEEFVWKPAAESNFTHHTPIFGTNDEINRLEQYAGYFMPTDSLHNIVFGSQLAQVVGVCHTLERARTMWPHTTGALYYKMNDNYPGLSWSCVDYYGAIKPLHYFARRSFAPVASVILFDRTNMACQDVTLPHYLLDDNETLAGDSVTVAWAVYNEKMEAVADTAYSCLATGKVQRLPDIHLTTDDTHALLLLFKSDVRDAQGNLLARNWYFANYETRPGVILQARKTTLQYRREGNDIVITNTGDVPAFGVTVSVPGKASQLLLSDNYLWIDAGETVRVSINLDAPVTVSAWNIQH